MKRLAAVPLFVIALVSCGTDDSSKEGAEAADRAGEGESEGEGEGEGEGEEPCAAPGAKGNSIGVGEYCTRGGRECDDNLEAFLCVVDIRPDAEPFCVKSCSTDEGCGENAVCTGEDGQGPKGCVPACILE